MGPTTCREGQSARQGPLRALVAVLFAALFVYLWRAIEPHLLYYGFGVFSDFPQFSWDPAFLGSRMSLPGGPISLLANFLAQWYYLSWLGAIILVTSLWVLFEGTRQVLRRLGQGGGLMPAFAAPLVAVMVLNRYDHPLQAVLAVSVTAWLAAAYLSLPLLGVGIEAIVFALLYGLCYATAGGAAMVFALVVGLARRQPLRLATTAFLAVGSELALGVKVFSLGAASAFTVATPLDPAMMAGVTRMSRLLIWGLYAFIPLAALAVIGWEEIHRRRLARQGKKPATSGPAGAGSRSGSPTRLWDAFPWVVGASVCVLCMLDRQTDIKYRLTVHDLARRGQWAEVLRLADEMQGRYAYTPACLFDVDRAMAHLGRMGEDMFKYPHDIRALAFLASDELRLQLRFAKLFDLHFDLGDLNAAEQDAYELLEIQGPSPFILEALARVHMAKGELAAARVVLKALQRSPAYRETASRWLEEMKEPSRLAADASVASGRRWRRQTDHEVRLVSYDQILLDLLRDHPDNRIAFEYLTAYYLLRNMRAELAANLYRVRDLGYGRLPRHYAEALVVHTNQIRQPLDLQGWSIDPGLTDQLRQITATWTGLGGDRQAAMAALAPQFGNTYTFYSIFNLSGVK
jgi:hypothetical protein